jgi:hypothetical protein
MQADLRVAWGLTPLPSVRRRYVRAAQVSDVDGLLDLSGVQLYTINHARVRLGGRRLAVVGRAQPSHTLQHCVPCGVADPLHDCGPPHQAPAKLGPKDSPHTALAESPARWSSLTD